MPSTVTATLADFVGKPRLNRRSAGQRPSAGHRIVGILIRWLVGSTPNSVPRGGRSSSGADRTDQHRVWASARPQRIKRVHEPELARGNGSRPEIWAKSLASHGNRDFKINRPIRNSEILTAAGPSAADPPTFSGRSSSISVTLSTIGNDAGRPAGTSTLEAACSTSSTVIARATRGFARRPRAELRTACPTGGGGRPHRRHRPGRPAVAAQLSEFPGSSTRVVERAPGPLEVGRADGRELPHRRDLRGLRARRADDGAEAYWVNETRFLGTGSGRPVPGRAFQTGPGRAGRPLGVPAHHRQPGPPAGLPARAHAQLPEPVAGRLRSTRPSRCKPPLPTTSPCLVTLRRSDGSEFSVRARYVVGCDGAHSTVRESIGRVAHGYGADKAWGVMDLLAVTDFPDIRLKATSNPATVATSC